MIRLALFVTLLLPALNVVSQQPNTSFREEALNKYAGKWEWRSDSSSFVLHLYVIKHTFKFRSDSLTKKVVIGFHSFTDNGRQIESCITPMDTTSVEKASFVGSADSTGRLTGSFLDRTMGTHLYVDLPYLAGEIPAIIWQSRYQELIMIMPDDRKKIGTRRTVPTGIVLTKKRDD